MREVIINQILYEFDQKTGFFKGMVLVQVVSLNKQQFWLFLIIETFVVFLENIVYNMLFL